MDFDFSEPQRILQESAKNFFEKEAKDFARKIEREEKQFSPEFWQKIVKLGWLGIIFPEDYGGAAGDFIDLTLLLEEMGKALIPSPFISTIVSGLALLNFGSEEQKRKFLPQLIDGRLIISPALLKAGDLFQGKEEPEFIQEKDNYYEISGTRLFVPYGHVANWLITELDFKDKKIFALLEMEAPGIYASLLPTLAPTGQSQVSFKNARVAKKDIMVGNGENILKAITEWGALAESAFILGMLEKVLSLTVEHAKQREQFGRPIGSFQAIQHQCADMITEIDKIKFLTYCAAWKLSEKLDATKEISMAKAKASEASRKVCLLGIKIHGGIGISEEHDLQIYFRMAKAAELIFGDGFSHREIIAKQIGL